MVGPLATDVHEAGAQTLLDETEASAHSQGALILGAHAHLDAMQTQLADDEVEDEGWGPCARPLSLIWWWGSWACIGSRCACAPRMSVRSACVEALA